MRASLLYVLCMYLYVNELYCNIKKLLKDVVAYKIRIMSNEYSIRRDNPTELFISDVTNFQVLYRKARTIKYNTQIRKETLKLKPRNKRFREKKLIRESKKLSFHEQDKYTFLLSTH